MKLHFCNISLSEQSLLFVNEQNILYCLEEHITEFWNSVQCDSLCFM